MKNDILYNLFERFIFEVYPIIETYVKDNPSAKRYETYPHVFFGESGMPNFMLTILPPVNITNLIHSWFGTADINLEEFESYRTLHNYLWQLKEYKDSAFLGILEESDSTFQSYASTFICNILERYYLLNNSKKANEKLLRAIYEQVENYIYTEELHFDIAIPILFIKFQAKELIINEKILIREITNTAHTARVNLRTYAPSIPESVIQSATHEIVFKNYYVKKNGRIHENGLDNENMYPIPTFELFFIALKIVTNCNSGFAQILIYPKDWADSFNMDLQPIKGALTKKYPSYFDDFYWNNNSFPIIKSVELKAVNSVFIKLLENNDNKISIACKRLKYSYYRDNEEDSILDIIIALETLLSDNEKGEITHKLALRIAKLLSKYGRTYDALQVFDAVKQIYGFRSAVVHGSRKMDSKREIKLHEKSEPIKKISLATNYLREILRILIENPKYLKSREIDNLLLK